MTTNPKNLNVIWAAYPGSQSRFLSCPAFEVLYEGTRGPGKTDALLMSYAQFVGRGYGASWRGIIFRKTFAQLADIIAKSKKWFYRAFPGARFLSSMTDYKWVFPSGEELLFRYIAKPNDYWNYHGHEYPFIGFEELTNWPTADCYEMMQSCCRSTEPNMPRMYRSTCNPHGVGHSWVKARFIDPAPKETPIYDDEGNIRIRIHGHWSENKHLVENDPDYIAKIKSITDPNKRKAWLDGDWDIAAGAIFSELWRERIHVIEPFIIPDDWYINRSFDWGSSAPFSIGWWAESNGEEIDDGRSWPAGTLFRIGEWYGCEYDKRGNPNYNVGIKMLSSDMADGVLEREAAMNIADRVDDGPADNSIWDGNDGTSIAEKMSEAGVDWVRSNKKKGSRIQGVEEMNTRLKASLQSPMESPGLFVFNTCRAFIALIPTLPTDPKNPDDVDTTGPDHGWDECRYRLLSSGQVVVA